MPTPASSSERRAMSPSKRRRADAGDNEMDQTPRANQPASGQQHTVVMLPPPDPPTFTANHVHSQSRGPTRQSGSGLSPNRKKRRTSPVKGTKTMRALSKPIQMKPLSDPESQLPADMLDLYTCINDIVVCNNEFIPVEAREDVTEVLRKSGIVRKSCPDDWFFLDEKTAADPEDGRASAEAELAELLRIKDATIECLAEQVSDAAWNVEVHAPLLRLATQGSGVKRLVIATARIAPRWLPTYTPASASASSVSSSAAPSTDGSCAATESGVTTGKMVDFALVLSESSTTLLGSAISDRITGAPPDEESINQSTYGPLTLRPLGVSVETKARQGNTDKGQVQLGLWTAAWFARVRALASEKGTRGMPTAMPVILAHESSWKLSFVYDRGPAFDFIWDVAMGDTRTLVGLYKLRAALRVLIRWMDTKLRAFFEDLLGVSREPAS